MSSVVREQRSVNGFDRVALMGVGDVIVTQGDQEAVEVEARSDILPHIKTEVQDSTLMIHFTREWTEWLGRMFDGIGPIKLYVTMKKVAGLRLSGAGRVRSARLQADQLDLSLTGAGQLAVDDVTANHLNAELSSVGSIEVGGKAETLRVRLSGAGSFQGGSLLSQTATVNLSGVGSATIWAADALDAQVSGAGTIEYFGSPRLNQRVSGLGKVRSLGVK